MGKIPKKAARGPHERLFQVSNFYVTLRVSAGAEGGPHCCMMPERVPMASYSAREENDLPQTTANRDVWG